MIYLFHEMASFQILQCLQVRQTVITKLEMWIMNPKISRQAQDLLLSVAVNCCTHSQADIDVIGNFIKLRLKNKPNVNLYLVRFVSVKHLAI